MRDVKAWPSWRLVSTGLALLGASGCAVPVEAGPNDEGDEAVAEVEEGVRNGTVVMKKGVVQFHLIGTPEDPRSRMCTGALISPRFLVTTASCLAGFVPESTHHGAIKGEVHYFDPHTGKRRITDWGETMHGFMKSTWHSGDTQSDIGLIRRDTDWDDTDNSDFLRLGLGSCSQIDRSDFYGRGYHDDSGVGDSQLRTMPINVKWCGEHHFFDLEGSRAMCIGDFGGPYIVNTNGGSGVDTLVGLFSNMERLQFCTEDGGKQRAVRINADKVGWIEDMMNKSCTSGTDHGFAFKRCF